MGSKSQFTQKQIIRALQEVDAGAKPEDVCRRLGVSDTTFYRWKSEYGGMDVSEAKRLKELETENARLKKLVAEQALDLEAVRSVLRKNGEALDPSPDRGLRPGEFLLERSRACRARPGQPTSGPGAASCSSRSEPSTDRAAWGLLTALCPAQRGSPCGWPWPRRVGTGQRRVNGAARRWIRSPARRPPGSCRR
jgi:putative transposase